ncbi:MAG: tripartite tricarboxylate transporter substrate binding protein [Acetobacteraceae bacterium]|nr:tripartite tricarboxylate transporter substrate binding protein [Acetobacteraceae bacterium]
MPRAEPSRRFLLAAPALLSLPAPLTRPAAAQERFPNRPIRLVIPVGVAGVTDIAGRVIGESMAQILGQPVVAENIAGAGGTVGAAAFLRAPADGQTLYIGTANAIMRLVYPNLAFDPVGDFVPLGLVGRQAFVMAVHPDVPARTIPELIAWLRTQGERANYGATNPGATNHLAGSLFQQLTGLDYTIVTYRTAAQSVQDLLAGRMHFTIDSPTLLMPLIRDGRVRPLGMTFLEPSPLLPGLAPIAQSVPGFEMVVWQGMFCRVGTPPDVVRVLLDAVQRVARDEPTRQRLATANIEPWADPSPEAQRAWMASETRRWEPVIRRMNLTG